MVCDYVGLLCELVVGVVCVLCIMYSVVMVMRLSVMRNSDIGYDV